jgi:Replication protein C N-terminal domain
VGRQPFCEEHHPQKNKARRVAGRASNPSAREAPSVGTRNFLKISAKVNRGISVSGNRLVCAGFRPLPAGFQQTQRENSCLNYPTPKPPSPTPIRAGARRINLDMRARLDQAERFHGFPRGTAKPFELLAAFEQAEPYLGLPPHAYKLIDWLVRQTRPQDWEEGSRPIAWPSARREAEFLGLSPSRVKSLNRGLWEAGIFVIRDDPQGRRYGRRDARGRIIEAYGFDLSPLALRYDEFVKIAAAEIERKRMRELRRRSTIARRGIAQAVEELGRPGQRQRGISPPAARDGRAGDGRPELHPLRRAGPCRQGPRKPQICGRGHAQAIHQTCGNRSHGA